MASDLLAPTGNEEAERAAAADEPRPGIWAGDKASDRRRLTQYETDMLIRSELALEACPEANRAELASLIGGTGRWLVDPPATHQRGGIDSDPLVRVLAYRAWGDRDRCWPEAARLLRRVAAGLDVERVDIDASRAPLPVIKLTARKGRRENEQFVNPSDLFKDDLGRKLAWLGHFWPTWHPLAFPLAFPSSLVDLVSALCETLMRRRDPERISSRDFAEPGRLGFRV